MTQVEENIYCCALTFAAIESVKIGKTVDIPEFLKAHMEESF